MTRAAGFDRGPSTKPDWGRGRDHAGTLSRSRGGRAGGPRAETGEGRRPWSRGRVPGRRGLGAGRHPGLRQVERRQAWRKGRGGRGSVRRQGVASALRQTPASRGAWLWARLSGHRSCAGPQKQPGQDGLDEPGPPYQVGWGPNKTMIRQRKRHPPNIPQGGLRGGHRPSESGHGHAGTGGWGIRPGQ